MAAKTTAQLTQEVEAQKAQIASLVRQVRQIWALLRDRMDGDGRVTKAMARATGQKLD